MDKLSYQSNFPVKLSRQPLEPTRTLTLKQQTLTVYLFCVGQGDHLLLELPNGEFGLIDFHYDSEHNPTQEPPALTFLKNRHAAGKPVVISFLCISHPDYDHVKGLCKVLEWVAANEINLDKVWLNPGVDEEDIYRALARAKSILKRSRSENVLAGVERSPKGDSSNYTIRRIEKELDCLTNFVTAWPGNPDLLQGISHLANLANTVEVCCLAPLTDDVRLANQKTLSNTVLWTHRKRELKLEDRNLLSSIIKMKFGQHQLLFGGDAGEEVWQRSLDEFVRRHERGEGPCSPSLRANFIKASHHGSITSSTVRLWERVMADTAHVGISAGKGQGHPDEETVDDIQIASRNRATTAHLRATNICSKCLINEPLPDEDWSWLPATVKQSKRDETADALRLDAPAEEGGAKELRRPSRSEVIRNALRAVAPARTVQENPQRGALIAYVFRFHSQSDEISVSKATADLPTRRECMFKYEGEKFFPACAHP